MVEEPWTKEIEAVSLGASIMWMGARAREPVENPLPAFPIPQGKRTRGQYSMGLPVGSGVCHKQVGRKFKSWTYNLGMPLCGFVNLSKLFDLSMLQFLNLQNFG